MLEVEADILQGDLPYFAVDLFRDMLSLCHKSMFIIGIRDINHAWCRLDCSVRVEKS